MPSAEMPENQHLGTSHSNCRIAKSGKHQEYTTALGKRDERNMGCFIRNHAGDSVCACVYKAVFVLLDSVVEFRKGVSEMTFFSSMMSGRTSRWEQCSHDSGVICRCLHVCLARELARHGKLAQLRSCLSCGLGLWHEVLREISFLSRGPDVNSERPVCGAEAGTHGTTACLGTVLGACVLAAH